MSDSSGKEDSKVQEDELFTVTKQEARELMCFFYTDGGYISHEFHPGVHDIVKRLSKFIGPHNVRDLQAARRASKKD